MSQAPTQPSPNAVDRIRQSVKYTEAQSTDLAGGKRSPANREGKFWAMITGGDAAGYSWSMMIPDGSGGLVEPDPPFTGDGTAVEINRCEAVPVNQLVRLTFVGMRADDVPLYAFSFDGSTANPFAVPLHDHRDNFNSGFAISAYHPGTALPLQPHTI